MIQQQLNQLISADSAVAVSYDFGNGFTVAAGIGGGGISESETVEDITVATLDATDIAEFVAIGEDEDNGDAPILIPVTEENEAANDADENVTLVLGLDATTTIYSCSCI